MFKVLYFFVLFFTLTGVVEYLTTEITTSKQKKFSLVTFVDTPGLVDGDMKYPFDVDQAILWLGMYNRTFFFFFPSLESHSLLFIHLFRHENVQVFA